MTARAALLPLAAAALAVALLGCGGEGGPGPDLFPQGLTLAPTGDYNGSRDFLAFDTLDGSSTATTTTAARTLGSRRLELVLPTSVPKRGDVFTFGKDGASLTYSEGSSRRWSATGGTIAVEVDEATFFYGEIRDAAFAPASGSAGARGGFVGNSQNATTYGYGVDQGPGALTVAAVGGGTNASLAPLGPKAGSVFTDGSFVQLAVGDDAPNGFERTLSLVLPENVAVGETGAFGGPSGGNLGLSEARDAVIRLWTSTGGTWTVVSRTRSNIEVRIEGATLVPDNANNPASSARGTIRFDGTMKR